jgi:hypothetical protein
MGSNAITGTSMDSASTLTLGGSNATEVTLGRSAGTTNVTGTTINLSGAVKATNIDTATATTLNIGSATTNDVTIGRVGLTNARMTATNVTLTGEVTVSGKLWAGNTAFNQIFANGITTSVCLLWDNLTGTSGGSASILDKYTGGVANILTAGARTAATNMLTSTSNNTFTLGGRSELTGLTLNLEGIAANFKSTVNNFTNAIRGIGSTLLVSTPLEPTYAYSATGTQQATAIGYQMSAQKSSTQTISTVFSKELTDLTFEITKGVWYVSAQIVFINNNESTQTYPRIVLQLGSGLTGNKSSNIAIYTLTNVTLGTTSVTGNQGVVTFGAMFSTNESTFVSASVVCDDASVFPLQFPSSNKLSATRVA